AGMADLPDQRAVVGEFEQHAVAAAIAGNPDEALLVDPNAVLGGRPIRHIARPAPRLEHVAFLVELDHRWGREAAIRARRRLRGARLVDGQGPRPLDDPDMVVTVDR